MSKKTYVCPHCQAQIKDLKGHIQRMHPEKLEEMPENSPITPDAGTEPSLNEPAPETGGETLQIAPPPASKANSETKYHCVDCGNILTKGQTPCPGCGTVLDWEAING